MTYTCTKCGETKAADLFPKTKRPRPSWCRDCSGAAANDSQAKKRAELRANPPEPPSEKLCGCCKRVLPGLSFSIATGSKDGLQSHCKECSVAAAVRRWNSKRQHLRDLMKANRARNKSREREKNARLYKGRIEKIRAHYQENKHKYKANSNRRRARIANAPGSHTKDDILAIFKRQGGRCRYCSLTLDKYHVDHIMPLALGGSNGPENLQILCGPCNLWKGSKHPEEFEAEFRQAS